MCAAWSLPCACEIEPREIAKGTDRLLSNRRHRRFAQVRHQSHPLHITFWRWQLIHQPIRHRSASLGSRLHRPVWPLRPCLGCLHDSAWTLRHAGISRCREDFPNRSVVQKPCREIDPDTWSSTLYNCLDTDPRICWTSAWVGNSSPERRPSVPYT